MISLTYAWLSNLLRFFYFHALVFFCITSCADKVARANEKGVSENVYGMTGLNTVPTARMDAEHTIRAGMSSSDPYNHAFIGLQIAKPLYVNLRQSMEVSSIGEKPSRTYPGMDIKLRLMEEGRYKPELAFGINSALGHKRFSSEYFALSKRYYNFDFTAGIAWGRMAGRGHIKNPFANIAGHFEERRAYSDEDASSPSDWFTGKDIGFFGGVEYHTPIDGFSLKADFNPDAYLPESENFGFDKPSPWSIGFNYSPKDWVSFGAAAIGAEKLMARLTFKTNLSSWNTASYKKTDRDENPRIPINDIQYDGKTVTGKLALNDYEPAPLQIGRAAKELAKISGKDIRTVQIIPFSKGTKAEAMTFSRRDLFLADEKGVISPEELWQKISFEKRDGIDFSSASERTYKIAPELSFSLGEEETTHLYRTSLVAEEQKQWGYGLITGNSMRLNIVDNLHRLAKFRDINLSSVRSDADSYTQNRINVDRSYVSFLTTPLPNFHFAATAGYLEEMFGGYGAEVLYRPDESPFSIGLEGWQVFKRDGTSTMALGMDTNGRITAVMNLYYDIPDTNITAFARAGKFIGGDVGVNTGAKMTFENGMKLGGSISFSNADNKDVFDSKRNIQAGLELTIPFGDMKFVPRGSEARINTSQIGRDDAAVLDKPIDLHDVTEPASYRRLGQSWQAVLK